MALSESVRRAIARDDLLMVARDAQTAVSIVKHRHNPHRPDAQEEVVLTERGLFERALQLQLESAAEPRWATRAQHLQWAAIVVRFSKMVNIEIGSDVDDVALLREAMAELDAPDGRTTSLYRDPSLGVIIHHRLARNLRLNGNYDEARELAERSQEFFHGAGAIPLYAELQFELGASLILDGQAAQVKAALEESDAFWNTPEASAMPTGYRHQFIRALAAWEVGEWSQVVPRMDEAFKRLAAADGVQSLSIAAQGELRDIQRLSLFLTRAEQRVDTTAGPIDRPEAVSDGFHAFVIGERIRSRWAVISRSRSPLSIAFRRIYGDLALVAASLAGPDAARLGLSSALAAKRTGFASLMRTGRLLMTERVQTRVDEIMRWEELLANSRTPAQRADADRDLRKLGLELETEISAMVADTVLPRPMEVEAVVAQVGLRCALDFVALPNSLSQTPLWFRTVVQPDAPLQFDQLEPCDHLTAYFYGTDSELPWLTRLDAALRDYGPDWQALGQELLPPSLMHRLIGTNADTPVDLVISPHSELSQFPWAALRMSNGMRLIDRALVTQTPALTFLTGDGIPAVTGPALVRLVGGKDGEDEDYLDVSKEREAWGLTADDSVMNQHAVTGTASSPMSGAFAEALAARPTPWGFVHVAAHGDGDGLGQRLFLPEALTAGRALGLTWPESVLMASCHIGRVMNVAEAELFGFLIAVFAGGARCVVAGLGRIPDAATSEIAARLVNQVRTGGVRLDHALRQAQREAEPHAVEYDWALLSAFVR